MEATELKDLLTMELKSFKEGLQFVGTGDLEKKFEEFEKSLSTKFEQKDYSTEIETLRNEYKNAIKIVEQNVQKPAEKMETKSLDQAILEMWESKGIKKASDLKSNLEFQTGFEFKAEVPTITTAQTGTIGRTDMNTSPVFPLVRPLAFIPFMRKRTLSAGKSIVGWTTGAYTSYVGYLGENAANATNDAATATEKTRGMSKVSAIKIITTEVEEDLPELARQMAVKMQEDAMVWIDGQIYGGDGNPDTNANPTHIYGLRLHATPFAATDFAKTVVAANIADLIDAIKTKAKKQFRTVTHVWLNPTDAYTYRRTKDNTGQYIINMLVTGESVISGLQVIETEAITAGTMLVGDASVMQLVSKRELTFKVGQFGDDAKYDRYSALLFMRAQVLVEDEDRKSLYYVASISADLAVIDSTYVTP